jgi:hypothetical protein
VPELFIKPQHDFRVAVGEELEIGTKLFFDLEEVVDLSVKYEDFPAILTDHRLVA